jgi:hypothetical protein
MKVSGVVTRSESVKAVKNGVPVLDGDGVQKVYRNVSVEGFPMIPGRGVMGLPLVGSEIVCHVSVHWKPSDGGRMAPMYFMDNWHLDGNGSGF